MQIPYPSGRVVKQDFDAAGRLCSVGASGSTCSTGTTYATGFAYNAASQVTGFSYGNGVAATFAYSSDRLQMTALTYTKSSQDLLKLNYWYKTDATYCPNAPAGNNGQIQCITDASNTTLTPGAGGRSVSYVYDALYRLTAATTSGSTQFPAWGLSWTYDRYGNRTAQSIASGCTGLTCPTNSLSISATTNRITDTWAAYDANGNMTNDGTNAMSYNAENRMVSSTGAEYVFDGAGIRVKKCLPNCTSPTSRTVYAFSGSKVIAEYVDGAGVTTPTREYIYLGSQLLAKVENSTTTYYHQDHLSNRVISDSSGNISAQTAHFPFGENWYESPWDPQNPLRPKFTTYERDSESGNDYAIFRTHISRFGRFSSPDPIAGSIADPQSLNRYAYTLNDPTNLIDPLGMRFCLAMGVDGTCMPTGTGRWAPIYDPWRIIGCREFAFGFTSDWPKEGYDAIYCWMTGGSCIFGYRLSLAPPQIFTGQDLGKLKQRVRKALARPECAALFGVGGAAEAEYIINRTTVEDASRPRDPDPALSRGYPERDQTAVEIALGFNPAAIRITRLDAPGGAWDGISQNHMWVGPSFSGQSLDAQATIFVHEILHVAWASTPSLIQQLHPRDGSRNDTLITERCGTELPKKSD